MAIILTCNTGASVLVPEGTTESIVSIRDPGAIAGKALFWRNYFMESDVRPSVSLLDLMTLGYSYFSQNLALFLEKISSPESR